MVSATEEFLKILDIQKKKRNEIFALFKERQKIEQELLPNYAMTNDMLLQYVDEELKKYNEEATEKYLKNLDREMVGLKTEWMKSVLS